MIEVLNNKQGDRIVAMYMKQDWTPCDKDEAEIVKLNYEDGRTVYLTPKQAATGKEK